ncbi:hypothetical protein [Aeromonas salmonicida]|uniref:hypothetical protein n=1 Tax=Aeromonas salmonicida TaxID=645 RepID=UPI0031FCC575
MLAIMGGVALIAMRYLPETLAPASRSQASLAVTMKDYAALAMDGRLLRYALAGGFYYGGCYAFIAGTPFAYVDYYQVSAQAYGLLYGSGVFSAALLGWCTDGTPWTMGWIVAVGGVGCLVFALWRRTEPEVSCEPMSPPEPVR